jgi:hypothetical protein
MGPTRNWNDFGSSCGDPRKPKVERIAEILPTSSKVFMRGCPTHALRKGRGKFWDLSRCSSSNLSTSGYPSDVSSIIPLIELEHHNSGVLHDHRYDDRSQTILDKWLAYCGIPSREKRQDDALADGLS